MFPGVVGVGGIRFRTGQCHEVVVARSSHVTKDSGLIYGHTSEVSVAGGGTRGIAAPVSSSCGVAGICFRRFIGRSGQL